MRFILAASLVLATAPICAQDTGRDHDRHHEEIIFSQASELLPWCRAEAEARYAGRGIMPYQWTGRYHDAFNVLYVEGKLRVHGDDVAVNCRVARNALERYAVIEIDDPSL